MSETSIETTPRLIPLPQRALVAVSGADAAHFLHSVLTANIEALAVGEARLAALLTPQGKIIADMLVANASDEEPLFFLDLNRGFAQDVAQRLATYRLRAKAEIAVLDPAIGVFVATDTLIPPGETFYAFADPRAEALGTRLYGPEAAVVAAMSHLPPAPDSAFTARRLALGIPECGGDYLPMAAYPHEANMDQLGGVDFKKGCYVGQEIVSRMEHRGTARTRTMIVRFLNGFGVDSGSEVRAGDQLLGSVGVCAGALGLSQIRLDRWQDALSKNIEITGGGVPISLEKPPYTRF